MFPRVKTDQVVVMPYHIHFILFFTKNEESSQTNRQATLSTVVQWFKTVTTNNYIRGVQQNDWPPFPRRLWQRNYYEHIIRNQSTLDQIRQYIVDNPVNWTSEQSRWADTGSAPTWPFI
ncbi:MAG: transposase [Planctomycetota bacterium]|nr:transposase [Planctomycetota bacterium]